MNSFIKNYYQNIIIYDLLTKLNFKNIFQINKINKINLNIGFKNSNIEKKKLINILLLLKLITNQQPFPTKSKKNNINLKIKKGNIVGCIITLRKRQIYFFLEKIFLFILSRNLNKVYKFNNKNILNFRIQNILNFFELETEFIKFKEIPSVNISIHTNSKNNKELFFFLNTLLNINQNAKIA